MDAKIYNMSGKEAGNVTLPDTVFAAKWNNDLVYQVVIAMQANARTPIAHAKDRSEVSGTGKKPWKQKGTGNARHGSRRSPIWRTGGVAHGPRNERSFKQKINKKMRTNAFYAVLTKKFEDGEVLFMDELKYDAPKTKEVKATIDALSNIKGYEELATKRANTALIAVMDKDENAILGMRNFSNFEIDEVRNLNPVNILKYKYLVIVGGETAVKQIESRKGKVTTEVSKK